jgi:hypothetical protein
MVAATAGDDEPSPGELATEPTYGPGDLVDFGEDRKSRKSRFLARWEGRMEEEDMHWRSRSGNVNVRFCNKHSFGFTIKTILCLSRTT